MKHTGNITPKDWIEDFDHENGNYTCQCLSCASYFTGHKRRVTCKECAMTRMSGENTRLTLALQSLATTAGASMLARLAELEEKTLSVEYRSTSDGRKVGEYQQPDYVVHDIYPDGTAVILIRKGQQVTVIEFPNTAKVAELERDNERLRAELVRASI